MTFSLVREKHLDQCTTHCAAEHKMKNTISPIKVCHHIITKREKKYTIKAIAQIRSSKANTPPILVTI